jgi:hypothetical protein
MEKTIGWNDGCHSAGRFGQANQRMCNTAHNVSDTADPRAFNSVIFGGYNKNSKRFVGHTSSVLPLKLDTVPGTVSRNSVTVNTTLQLQLGTFLPCE